MNKTIPYGYRMENGIIVVDEANAERVRMIFDAYCDGGSLKTAGQAAGVPFVQSCIRGILTNPVYLGTAEYPQIISEESFRHAGQRVRERGAAWIGKTGRKPRKPIRVFTDFCQQKRNEGFSDDPAERAAQLYRCIQVKGE